MNLRRAASLQDNLDLFSPWKKTESEWLHNVLNASEVKSNFSDRRKSGDSQQM